MERAIRYKGARGALCYDPGMSLAPRYVDIGTFIDQREGYRGGRPFVVGTGITIDAIACRHTVDGWDAETIAAEYTIELEQVLAALAFYFANREAIDDYLEAQARDIDRLARDHAANASTRRS